MPLKIARELWVTVDYKTNSLIASLVGPRVSMTYMYREVSFITELSMGRICHFLGDAT